MFSAVYTVTILARVRCGSQWVAPVCRRVLGLYVNTKTVTIGPSIFFGISFRLGNNPLSQSVMLYLA